MKVRLVLGTGMVAGVAVAAMSLARPLGAQEGDAMANTLEGKIARLERKVQMLETQVSLLQRNRSIVMAPSAATTINPQSTLPRGSKPFEFNGGTFYLVPAHKPTAK